MFKDDQKIKVKLPNGKDIHFTNYKLEDDPQTTHQLECKEMLLTIIDKRNSDPEYVEICESNSEFESENFVVAEFIGKESQSDNWSPDLEESALTDQEIEWTLRALEDVVEYSHWKKTWQQG